MFDIRFQSSTHRKQTRRWCCLAKDKLQISIQRFFVVREKRSCRVVTKSRVFNRVYFSVLRDSIKENNNSSTVWGRNVIPEFESVSMKERHCRMQYNDTFTYAQCTTWHCDTSPRNTLMVHAVTMWAVDGIEEWEEVSPSVPSTM